MWSSKRARKTSPSESSGPSESATFLGCMKQPMPSKASLKPRCTARMRSMRVTGSWSSSESWSSLSSPSVLGSSPGVGARTGASRSRSRRARCACRKSATSSSSASGCSCTLRRCATLVPAPSLSPKYRPQHLVPRGLCAPHVWHSQMSSASLAMRRITARACACLAEMGSPIAPLELPRATPRTRRSRAAWNRVEALALPTRPSNQTVIPARANGGWAACPALHLNRRPLPALANRPDAQRPCQ